MASEHQQTKTYADYGTAAMTNMCNAFGGMPTLNFSTGQFEAAENISGEALRQRMLNRDGESVISHACMAGCAIQCSNVFAGFGFSNNFEVIPALLNARYGWDTNVEILEELGRDSLKLEREFNHQAGFTPADDRIPEWMTHEPLPPHNSVFDVPEEEMDTIFD